MSGPPLWFIVLFGCIIILVIGAVVWYINKPKESIQAPGPVTYSPNSPGPVTYNPSSPGPVAHNPSSPSPITTPLPTFSVSLMQSLDGTFKVNTKNRIDRDGSTHSICKRPGVDGGPTPPISDWGITDTSYTHIELYFQQTNQYYMMIITTRGTHCLHGNFIDNVPDNNLQSIYYADLYK